MNILRLYTFLEIYILFEFGNFINMESNWIKKGVYSIIFRRINTTMASKSRFPTTKLKWITRISSIIKQKQKRSVDKYVYKFVKVSLSEPVPYFCIYFFHYCSKYTTLNKVRELLYPQRADLSLLIL